MMLLMNLKWNRDYYSILKYVGYYNSLYRFVLLISSCIALLYNPDISRTFVRIGMAFALLWSNKYPKSVDILGISPLFFNTVQAWITGAIVLRVCG